MSAQPGNLAKLKTELEQLASERRWSEIRERVVDLEDAALASDPKLAFRVAEALAHLGRVQRAFNLVLAAEAEFRTRHDPVNLMAALNLTGAMQFELGDLEGADARFSELLELARERGDDEMSGRATNNLGAIASLRGEHERALSLFRLSVPAYQKVGFGLGLALTAHNLGIVHRDLGYWREADGHYRRAQRRARQMKDERVGAMARAGRAEISHLRGDDTYAGAEVQQALEVFTRVGDELGRAEALKLLGSIASARQEWSEAGRHLDAALLLARDQGNLLLEAEILEERAALHAETGQAVLGRADLEAAAAAYRRLGAAARLQSVESRLEGWGR